VKEVQGDIWDFYKKGHWIAIPTNGSVKSNGEAVMGRGVALQAKLKFPELPEKVGRGLSTYLNYYGKDHYNRPQYYQPIRIATFPVKYSWQDKASLDLIEYSCNVLVNNFQMFGKPLYLPRVGCGNGGLSWEAVKPILERCLDDDFVVVRLEEAGI